MSQNVFINITADKNANNKGDRTDHSHTGKRGTSASGDLTISFDSTALTKLNSVRSAVAQALKVLEGGTEVT